MIKVCGKLSGGVVALLFVFFFLLPPASAKTFVAQNSQGNHIVTIKIVFDFSSVANDTADTRLKKWQGGMVAIWDNKITASGQQVTFNFDLQKMAKGKTCADYPEYHCLLVVESEKNSRGSVSDVSFIRPNSGKNATGEWTVYTSALDAAHEAGHLMGLPDEYHFEIKNNRRIWVNDGYRISNVASIMSRTWGKVAAYGEDISKIVVYADKQKTNSYSLAIKE